MPQSIPRLRAGIVLVNAGLGAILSCGGAEYPLVPVNLTPLEAMSLPGVSGTLLFLTRPEGVREETQPMSARPLYGTLEIGRVFRLDESQGTDRGYDRLLVDLNGNGVLTDDRPYQALAVKQGQAASGRNRIFGPIEIPCPTNSAAWRPAFYATPALYSPQALRRGRTPRASAVGYLSTKPAAYLKARVEIDGVAETVGFLDGNGNLRLDDVARFADSAALRPREWEWLRADYLFRDRNGSGRIERNLVRDELELLSLPIYFAGKPFQSSFPANGQLRLVPDADLGTLRLTSECPLESLVLLRKTADGQWQILVPQVIDNKVLVPAGVYRLASCCSSVSKGKEQFFGQAFMNGPAEEVAIGAGQTVSLPCGPPFKATITALSNRQAQPFSLPFSQRSLPGVILRGRLCGAGGETYTTFYRGSRPPQPVVPRFPSYEISGRWFGKFYGTLQRERDGSFATVRSLPSHMANQQALVTVTFDLRAIGFDTSCSATAPLEIKSP